jgi:hypothetical protein
MSVFALHPYDGNPSEFNKLEHLHRRGPEVKIGSHQRAPNGTGQFFSPIDLYHGFPLF